MKKFLFGISISLVVLFFVIIFFLSTRPLGSYSVRVLNTSNNPVENVEVRASYAPLSSFPDGGDRTTYATTNSDGIATFHLPFFIEKRASCASKEGYFSYNFFDQNSFGEDFFGNVSNNRLSLWNIPGVVLKSTKDINIVGYISSQIYFDKPQKLPTNQNIKTQSAVAVTNSNCDDSIDFNDLQSYAVEPFGDPDSQPDFVIKKLSDKQIEIDMLNGNTVSLGEGVGYGYGNLGQSVVYESIPPKTNQTKLDLSVMGYGNGNAFYHSSANVVEKYFIIYTKDSRIFIVKLGLDDSDEPSFLSGYMLPDGWMR